MSRRDGKQRPGSGGLWVLLLLLLQSCTFLPAEFNLSPFYRHRLDEKGEVLELDVLWPIIHYEQTPEGGDDFRIRPFWRWIENPPEPGAEHRGATSEHQYLWPLGRSVSDEIEQSHRLWPLWWHRSRIGMDGQRETDWYALFPFIWGGGNEDGTEDYFGVLPFYLDIPQFLTYDRFHAVLFPLYLGLDKNEMSTHQVLWPIIGWSEDHAGRGREETKVWPLYVRSVDPSRYDRTYAPWPFIGWGRENLWTDDPVDTLWLWPFYGQQTSEQVDSWTVLWPFFQHSHHDDLFTKTNILWPFFQYRYDRNQDGLEQWWLWPLVARTESDRQSAWNFLWPLVWIREYDDPEGKQTQEWVLPFYWHVNRQWREGGEDDFVKVWPLLHVDERSDGRGDWSFPSPWPWRDGNAYGVEEAYGWMWTVAKGRSRSATDHSFELAANAYTTRTRRTAEGKTRTQSSVPFLFSWDGDEDGGTLRLFQFLPISFGGSDAEGDSTP